MTPFQYQSHTSFVAQITALKQRLFEAVAPLNYGADMTPEEAAAVLEIVAELKTLNPTASPAASPAGPCLSGPPPRPNANPILVMEGQGAAALCWTPGGGCCGPQRRSSCSLCRKASSARHSGRRPKTSIATREALFGACAVLLSPSYNT